MSVGVRRAKQAGDGADGKFIADRPEAGDRASGDVREIGCVAERLPRLHIAQVNLDKGNADPEQGVAQGHAGMSEGCRVDQDEIDMFPGRLVDSFDQFMLGITLEACELMSALAGQLFRIALDLGKRDPAVDAWFPLAEEIQVGAV